MQLQHITFVLCACVHTMSFYLLQRSGSIPSCLYWCTRTPVNLCSSIKSMYLFECVFNIQIDSDCPYCVADLFVCSLWALCLFSDGRSVAPLCTASTDSCDVLGRTDRFLSLTLRLLIRIQHTSFKYPSISLSPFTFFLYRCLLFSPLSCCRTHWERMLRAKG